MKLPRRQFLHLAAGGGELRGQTMRQLTTIAALAVALVTPAAAQSRLVVLERESGSGMAEALQRETQTIPVVFVAVTDPLSSGLVASMARPGGNLTGFANYVASKACRSDCKRPDPPGLRRRGPWATTQRLLGAPPHSFGFRACGGGRIYVPQFVPCQRGYDALLLAADDVRV